MTLYKESVFSPIGLIEIQASETGITQIHFVDEESDVVVNSLTTRCKQQLEEYFAGKRQEFDLPLDAEGSGFQHLIWQQLCKIPYGETKTYGEIAAMANNPQAARAVGAANGKNPLFILVPCHRVIGSDGSLTGYAGGTDRKAWLLDMEKAVI